jgi:peptidyl-prolyl cis-trans isomerase A (cyclophilin A)
MANRTANVQTNQGSFTIELFDDRAPKTAQNFIDLAEKGFYDGIGTGRGGPGYTIPDEFHAELQHTEEGILSMANAGPNTGGSQFFITLAPTPWLDRKHAIFGRVVEGMDVVRTIGSTATGPGDRPVEEVVMDSVKIEGGVEG